VVTRGSLLYRWWKDGKYKPYSDKVLKNLIIKCKLATPEYVRIIRLIRDIPGESIIAGNKITNLRQIIKDEGVKCRCIRCREARGREFKAQSSKCQIIKYQASGGQEYFMSYESEDRKILYGFCRLRLVDNKAIIRELHVYGQLVSIGEKKRVQHAGLGQLLLKEAEKIAEESGFKKIVVISGVGVRGYYRKFGYRLKETYMLKNI
jgi:elongator complex protein 3